LFHDHQTRAATKEDFIGGSLLDAWLGDRIEDGQQGGGLLGGRLRPASQLRNTRRPLRQERQEQAPRDGQADAFGLGDSSETGEVVGIEDQGLLELALELIACSPELVDVVLEGLEALLGVGAGEGLEDCGRVPVQGLTGEADPLRLSGDRPIGAVENSGGVGDTQLGR
jgi:hypothetical protein